MTVYLDTSCLLKVLLLEPESEAVRQAIAGSDDVVVSTAPWSPVRSPCPRRSVVTYGPSRGISRGDGPLCARDFPPW